MLSGFAAVRSPSRAACARTSALVSSPTGKQRTGELALPEHVEHVRLVLRPVGPASQLEGPVGRRASTRAWWPVATWSNPSASARSRSRPNLIERLHSTHGFGVRPARVLVDVGIDDGVVEVVGEVEHVVRDAELRGDAPGVLDVGDAATAGVGLAAPQLEGDAGDVVPLLEQQRGRDRRVDPAAHRDEDPRLTLTPRRRAARSCATAPGSRRGRRRRRHRSTRSRGSGGSTTSASSRGTPIAASTCDGSVAPDEHDEPAAAHTPAWSSATSSVSASTPRNPRCALPATLRAPVAVLERPREPRRAGRRPGDRASAPMRTTSAARASHVARSAAAIATAPGDVRRAGPEPALLAAAFDQRLDRGRRRGRRAHRCPSGPPNLCAEIATRSTPAAARATSSHGTACTASVCTTALGARSRTPATILSSGWIVPTSLFTSITDTTAVRSSTRGEQPRRRRRRPTRGTGRPPRSGSPRPRAGRTTRARPCARTPVVTTPSPRPVRAGPAGRPLHREVVGLGAAGGEHDLGRADAEQLGDLLPGLLERRLRRPRRRVAARSGCRTCPAGTAPSPRPPRAASAWWRRDRGR